MPDAERWSDTVAVFGGQRHRLWRDHSDRVNLDLLDAWLGAAPCGLLLKTDLFDEAVGGGLCRSLAARARRVIGIDVSASTVAHARANGDLAIVADVRRLPFPPRSLDTIVSISTLDHFDSMNEVISALTELSDALRPGGTLVVTLDNPENPKLRLRSAIPWSVLKRTGLVPYYVGPSLTRRQLCGELRALGFEIVDVRAVMHAPRVTAVALSRLSVFARPGWRRAFLAALARFEMLGALPTRYLTAHFIAVLALKPAARA